MRCGQHVLHSCGISISCLLGRHDTLCVLIGHAPLKSVKGVRDGPCGVLHFLSECVRCEDVLPDSAHVRGAAQAASAPAAAQAALQRSLQVVCALAPGEDWRRTQR